jgi:hypothetical protein
VDAYLQEFDNWFHDWGQVRRSYDVPLFCRMHTDLPEGPYREALQDLSPRPQGVVILPRALLAWPGLEASPCMVGIPARAFGYYMEQTIRADVAQSEHPIVQGIAAWDMPDETYTMASAGTDSEVILTATHHLSMHTTGRTRRVGESQCFCFQTGHDQRAQEHPSFREVLGRGVRRTVGRLG